MPNIKFNLIVSTCENNGMGINGDLPWRIPSETEYYLQITTECKEQSKKNAIILGRKSWEATPWKPHPNCINLILTRSDDLDLSGYPDTYTCKSLADAVQKLEEDEDLKKRVGDVWITGGSTVYKDALNSKHFYRLYHTRIFHPYECDTYFPTIPQHVKRVEDPRIPQGIKEDAGHKYLISVYENLNFNKE
ncbi:dihydrofolate reductase-like [Anthonomus grandis grandis]|uniref:dihydrofolate reductase-like n=1 Tax=Anthonomus grandis grandis TaxID=2921223 RepID=UPI002164F4B9|nr:dihydrofolate reductase-like [Anthonomus grandis grandis]